MASPSTRDRLLRWFHALLLVVVVVQPGIAIGATIAPGAEWIELGPPGPDACGTACCCAPDACPCDVAPRVPADAPLPQFAPEASAESWRTLFAVFAEQVAAVHWPAAPTATAPDCTRAHERPPPRAPLVRAPRTLGVHLAVLQTALL